MAQAFKPIQIVEIITDEVGVPRNDGTPGSALYAVPFRLTQRPPSEWAECFVTAWNNPTSYTSMHRSGIAQVTGNKIILDGTTMDEIEKYHHATLIAAVDRANNEYVTILERRRREAEREQAHEAEHRKNVEEAAKRLKF